MKKIIIITLISISLFLLYSIIIFFSVVFIKGELNPFKWSQDVRFATTVVCFLYFFAIDIVIDCLKKEIK